MSNQDSSIVYINNSKIGYTPLVTTTNKTVVEIKVQKEGFEDYIYSDTLKSDSVYSIDALLYKTVQLEITSNQDSSIVFINNNKIGYTPLVTTTNKTVVEIKVQKEGFEDYVFSDTLKSDSVNSINALLYTKEEKLFRSRKSGTFKDFRDNKKYKWIKIGKQIWMAENLAYKSLKCWAYNNNTKNIEDYGYLYDWKSAQEACPQGWHIPTETEWKQLSDYLGGDNKASEKLREQGFSHWVDGYYYRPIATNKSGFTARPGGQRNAKGEFITIGTYANFWSSSELNEYKGVCYWLGYMGDYLNKEARKKSFALSVRCVKNQ
jgi:uncharacterized protein (TIGR02145 family)